MSEQVERRLVELLGHPDESPYGNPIPGLHELGDFPEIAPTDDAVGVVKRLDAAGGEIRGRVRRLAEPVQADPELLQQLRDAGVVPGAEGSFRYSEGYVLVQMAGAESALELPVEMASHIFLVGGAETAAV